MGKAAAKTPLLLEEKNFKSCPLSDIGHNFPAGYPAIYGLCTVAEGRETVVFISCCEDLLPTVAEVLRRPAVAALKPTHVAARYHPAATTDQWAARATETVRYRTKYEPQVRDRD